MMISADLLPRYLCLLAFLFVVDCAASDRRPTAAEDPRTDAALMDAAQTEMLVGAWFSDTGAGPTTISKDYISWSGCMTTYSIVQRSVGKTFPDKPASFSSDSPEIKVGRYVTVKLKLEQKKCIGDNSLGFLQFSFMTINPGYSYATVVQYTVENRPIAWHSLSRR